MHESKGVTDDYLKLESLLQKVVSPYLGTHGLYSNDGTLAQCTCVLEKRLLRRWPKSGDAPAKNPVVRSKSYNMPMLTPVAEYDAEVGSAGSAGIRRHSVCEMTSCVEEPAYAEDSSASTSPGTDGSLSHHSSTQADTGGKSPRPPHSPSILPETSLEPFLSTSGRDSPCQLGRDGSLASRSSSPETIVDQILESLDSDHEGIFIDFPCQCSNSSSFSRESGRQSVV